MDLVKIGKKLREARKEKKYNLRDVGEITDLDFSYIGKIENGKVTNPSLKTLEKLCKLYGIKESELFGNETELPEEFKEIGVEWITLAKEMKKEWTPEEVRKYLKIFKQLKEES